MPSKPNKLWCLLSAMDPSESLIMKCIDEHPEYCSIAVNGTYPIHVAVVKSLSSLDVTRKMISCCPHTCQSKKEGNLLLHDVLFRKQDSISSEIILLIIKAYPDAVRMKDCYGCLPLQRECQHHCRYDVIVKLHQVFPGAISMPNSDMNLPLHLVMFCQRSTVDVVSFLIGAYSDALRMKNYDNEELPLHIECQNLYRYDVIVKLLEVYPDAICIPDECNRLALHLSLSSRCPSETILFLIQQYPDAARIQSTGGQLPIHIECYYQCRYDIISKLLELYPDAVTLYDAQHRLPLHCASEYQRYSSHADVVYLLIKAHPEAVREKDNRGYLPIHLECMNNCRFDVIVKLLELYPYAINIADNNGDLPLHRALCSYSSTIEVTSLLISKYHLAASVKNLKDEFPLHVECKRHLRYHIIALLLDICPDAMIMPDINGMTPWNYAIRASISSVKVNVIQLMITKHPGAAKMPSQVNGIIRYPFHQLFDVYHQRHINFASKSSAQSNQCKALALELLNLYPEALYLPADQPYINSSISSYNPLLRYRMLLNTAYHHISLASAKHMHDYHTMNYQPRSCLLHLLYQLSYSNNYSDIMQLPASIATSKIVITQQGKPRNGSKKRSTAAMNGSLHGVLLSMLGATGSMTDGVTKYKYGWMKGDDLECILLRKVVSYL